MIEKQNAIISDSSFFFQVDMSCYAIQDLRAPFNQWFNPPNIAAITMEQRLDPFCFIDQQHAYETTSCSNTCAVDLRTNSNNVRGSLARSICYPA